MVIIGVCIDGIDIEEFSEKINVGFQIASEIVPFLWADSRKKELKSCQ